jgi:hypothetical protein
LIGHAADHLQDFLKIPGNHLFPGKAAALAVNKYAGILANSKLNFRRTQRII